MKVIRNTYPVYPKTPHAEAGDEVHWEMGRGQMNLIRESDGKPVFATAPVDRDGLLRSNGLPPVAIGIVAQIKSRGWILEIA